VNTLTTVRKSTSAKLAGLAIPDCFAAATVATAALDKGKSRNDRRRNRNKAFRIVGAKGI
jgi:hypothetical protein